MGIFLHEKIETEYMTFLTKEGGYFSAFITSEIDLNESLDLFLENEMKSNYSWIAVCDE